MRNSAGLFFAPCRSPDERKICMIYSKEALSLEEQADQLIGRGLIADRDELIGRLEGGELLPPERIPLSLPNSGCVGKSGRYF
jgi:hypothetical protein